MKIRKAERIFFVIGLACLALWPGARVHGSLASHVAIERFQANVAEKIASDGGKHGPKSESKVDFTQWSSKRVAAYKENLPEKVDLPLAILRIPKISHAPCFRPAGHDDKQNSIPTGMKGNTRR